MKRHISCSHSLDAPGYAPKNMRCKIKRTIDPFFIQLSHVKRQAIAQPRVVLMGRLFKQAYEEKP